MRDERREARGERREEARGERREAEMEVGGGDGGRWEVRGGF
jgi:hypothetical protein